MNLGRINIKEITFSRMVSAIITRAKNIPYFISWNSWKKKNSKKLNHFHDKHAGERIFLIANGPSLAQMDLTPLKHKITFGMNRIYLLEEKMGFSPNYFSCINELVLEQFSPEIDSLNSIKYLNYNRNSLFTKGKSNYFLKTKLALKDKFSYKPFNGVYSGGTVTYVALQLIYALGFSEVIIIGLDHNFKDKGIPNKTEIRKTELDDNHFHPDYFPKGFKWQLPDLLRSEMAYSIARRVFEKDNRRIIDCTVNGKCNIFEKGEYENFVNDL